MAFQDATLFTCLDQRLDESRKLAQEMEEGRRKTGKFPNPPELRSASEIRRYRSKEFLEEIPLTAMAGMAIRVIRNL